MARLLNPGGLQARLVAVGNRKAEQAVRKGTREVFTRSQILCPVDRGLLRASGSMQFRMTPNGPEGKVEYTARYAAAVNNGRRAVIIRPRSKRFLKFTINGRTVFAREVHQRSRRAKPFLTRAAQEVAAANGWSFRRS